MRKPSKIALHRDELKEAGVEIKSIKILGEAPPNAHRDDHYMFVIQSSGIFLWQLDFVEVRLKGPALCFIVPGQVHRYIDYRNSEGWLIFVDAGLLSNQYREIFDTFSHARQAIAIRKDDLVLKLIPILQEVVTQRSLTLRKSLLQSLTETLCGSIASKIAPSQDPMSPFGGQKFNVAVQFKQLVSARYREIKQVKAYASLLHITPLYLNEVVKEMTGFTASYWINQEILLETKRLLYFTSLDVKQIAFDLGYEDHAYFSRFFKKHTGMTALTFRAKNHPLSNDSH